MQNSEKTPLINKGNDNSEQWYSEMSSVLFENIETLIFPVKFGLAASLTGLGSVRLFTGNVLPTEFTKQFMSVLLGLPSFIIFDSLLNCCGNKPENSWGDFLKSTIEFLFFGVMAFTTFTIALTGIQEAYTGTDQYITMTILAAWMATSLSAIINRIAIGMDLIASAQFGLALFGLGLGSLMLDKITDYFQQYLSDSTIEIIAPPIVASLFSSLMIPILLASQVYNFSNNVNRALGEPRKKIGDNIQSLGKNICSFFDKFKSQEKDDDDELVINEFLNSTINKTC